MLTPTQYAFATSRDPFPAFVGGFGSGKTAAAIARAMALKAQFKAADVAYYLPTYPLVEDIAFRRFPELCERKGWDFKLNQQSATLEFPGSGRIVFRTMERPERIVGYEVAHSVLDELDTLPAEKANEVWNRVIARNRQKCSMPNTVAVATTPEGFRFVYERWVKNPAPGYTLFRAKTMDNAANLPPGYVDNLRNTYPAVLLEAYLDGEFVNLTNGLVRRDWFRPSTLDPAHLPERVMGVDLAISLKDGADSSAIVVGGLADGAFHVADAQARKATFHDTLQWINATAERWGPKVILVEAVQYQLAAVQELMRTTTLPVIPVRPDRDKAARLAPLAARYEQGLVRHAPARPSNAIKALEDELAAFPGGAHDDLVDALVYAWQGASQYATPQPIGVQVRGL